MAETPQQKLTRLKALLESGVTSTTVDGESVTLDLKAVRRAVYLLEVQLGYRRKRSRILNVDMGRR